MERVFIRRDASCDGFCRGVLRTIPRVASNACRVSAFTSAAAKTSGQGLTAGVFWLSRHLFAGHLSSAPSMEAVNYVLEYSKIK
jgi:hypothetical protein